MAYRRKSSPAAQLSLFRQLQLMCNATSLGLPFQVHNAQSMLDQLKINNTATYAQFTKNATRQDFFPSRVVGGSSDSALITDAPTFTLPLPRYFVNPSETAEDFVPRVFYHSSMVKCAAKLRDGIYLPRCGLTGLFFSREEVVDNLQTAAAELGFKSPFWIRKDHPALGNFLELKDESDVICLSLTAAITSIDNVECFHEDLWHPNLRQAAGSRGPAFGSDVPLGMNAFSGFVTKNPFVQSLPNRGVWISQEQVLQNNLKLKKKASASSGNPFLLIEVEQWEMHNADQLSVPGRLALHRSAAKGSEGVSVFS
ncbi:hypothetical protein TraAM80_06993 [Trypanosoma rangeli]|uniref:Trypanosoma Tc-38 (p38) protein domain-containing protein n=1 Tax=Trypanosoma rangeli TaxID=5698 RepID=A0A3R7LQI0_TRYRA|nr:uncharacterized protein TraAM80_06993 [Trypanosoma rangeli]RNF01452.1 hypothetical protein TraAM80_06993 [Trypanosoma rangeli]|eukprot:RNF01452.1 hypothetical protein TraAM80_06993 [Trypanosoma rangeli]